MPMKAKPSFKTCLSSVLIISLFLMLGSSGLRSITKTVYAENLETVPPVQVIEEFETLNLLSSFFAQANSAELSLVERPQTIFYGNHAVNLTYDFTGKTGTSAAYLQFKNDQGGIGRPLPGSPSKIGVWVYGDGGNHWLRAQIEDALGTRIAADFTTASGLNWTGWKYVTLQIPSLLTPPLKLNHIYVAETKDTNKNSGQLYFDRLSAIYTDNALYGLDITGGMPIKSGESTQLLTYGTYADANMPTRLGEGVTYTSSDESIATVTGSSYGSLTALSPGSVIITASYEGISEQIELYVTEESVSPASLEMSGPVELEAGTAGEVRVYAHYTDYNSPYWIPEGAEIISDDSSILRVDENGLAHALRAGTANIIASYGGASAVLTVTVKEPVPVLQNIELNGPSALDIGSSAQTHVNGIYSLLPDPVPLTEGVSFTSSHPDIASVSAEGELTGHAVGGSRITASYNGKSSSIYVVVNQTQETPKREVRAAWIATVENIDWPLKGTTDPKTQKSQFRELLDGLEKTGINTLIVQVKPTADAFYPSEYGPWSEWLTGVQGQDPGYDPLAFMLEEAHERGMEFHAWFNPYRVSMQTDLTKLTADHPARQHPEWVESYGGKLYFNPGVPEAKDFIIESVMEVVRNYDIDGVHFDDYFYPYPAASGDFPDADTYIEYGADFANISDWRRDNVNRFVQEAGEAIKAEKSYVKYGISPFGIWKNKAADPLGSDTNGLSSYDAIYADSKKWVDEEWIDYIMPQIYWYMGYGPAAYDKLTDWWSDIVSEKNVHLYIGQALYRNGTVDGWLNSEEIPNQITYNRNYEEVKGSAFFSAKWFEDNILGITDRLRSGLYAEPALIPEMPWLDDEAPSAPNKVKANSTKKAVKLEWNSGGGDETYYVIYRFEGSKAGELKPAEILAIVQREGEKKQKFEDKNVPPGTYTYVITAVDRLHNESVASSPATVIQKK
ncbi:family 10 glycosylhydrolase [Neobacillus mesonae]|nr:family 10 glycosylhydrolase [Neobacillus mesonae]